MFGLYIAGPPRNYYINKKARHTVESMNTSTKLRAKHNQYKSSKNDKSSGFIRKKKKK